MSDLIDRTVLKAVIQQMQSTCIPYEIPQDAGYDSACEEILEAIEGMPSAQPKTGRWIKATGMMPPEFHGHHCCSECGNFASMCPPLGNREDLSDFCPYCGARMKEADDERL